jgi:hypothetical protein
MQLSGSSPRGERMIGQAQKEPKRESIIAMVKRNDTLCEASIGLFEQFFEKLKMHFFLLLLEISPVFFLFFCSVELSKRVKKEEKLTRPEDPSWPHNKKI